MSDTFHYFLYLILVTYTYAVYDNSKIICTSEDCDSAKCPSIPTACQIQNSTHNGIFLKSPTICNCCKYCLQNLAAGESCVSGSPGGSPPSVICGGGLTCNEDEMVCKDMSTKCLDEQRDFDNRKLNGHIGYLESRPQCDKEGKYQPLVCITGEICFCVDEEGNRIFGEIPFNSQPTYITKCGCSRDNDKVDDVANAELNVLKRTRCLPDGNYDTLQCINNQCTCVDKENASPIDPAKKPVYVGLISELPCFNENIHIEGLYLRPCEKEYSYLVNATEMAKEDNFETIGVRFPNCQLDGRYAAVQENRTHKYCTDPDNNILENFIVDKTDSLADSMNCYCARARSIITGFEKPSCLENGNYKPKQCRRGKCRCVDINGVETLKVNLPCSS